MTDPLRYQAQTRGPAVRSSRAADSGRMTYAHNFAVYCTCGWEWVGPEYVTVRAWDRSDGRNDPAGALAEHIEATGHYNPTPTGWGATK